MSRRKFAEPSILVPGATRRVDPTTLMPEFAVKNKVPLWNMPAPVRFVEHVRRRLDKKTKMVITDKVAVPIYRGIASSLARLIRSEFRRNEREAAVARKHDLSKAAAAHEAETKMADSIINPGGENVGK